MIDFYSTSTASLDSFFLSGKIPPVKLKRARLDNLQFEGDIACGLEVYIPDHIAETELENITLKVTSAVPDSFIVLIAIPQGHLDISLHDGGHRMIFATANRIEMKIRAFGPSEFIVGENTFCAGARAVVANASVLIGPDCLLSDDILIQAGDQHSILDARTRKQLNGNMRRLKIGQHVWIGRRAVICNRADIGNGAILGTAAVAGGTIPAFSVAVGNPARPVKTDISWSLGPTPQSFEDAFFTTYDAPQPKLTLLERLLSKLWDRGRG